MNLQFMYLQEHYGKAQLPVLPMFYPGIRLNRFMVLEETWLGKGGSDEFKSEG